MDIVVPQHLHKAEPVRLSQASKRSSYEIKCLLGTESRPCYSHEQRGTRTACELCQMWSPIIVFYEQTDGARLC